MKWLLQNLRRRAGFAFKNPRYALHAMVREFTLADERFLAHITGASPTRIRSYLDEPIGTPDFAAHLHSAEKQFRRLSIESADLFAKKVLNQYATVRALAPELIVETGIANGVSTSYLLLAMRMNGRGHLHSVGLSDPRYLPGGRESGWLVPEWLRAPWKVHLGDAREILPSLFAQIGNVDMFIHDSLHTYEHMMWEFEASYPRLRVGGLLFADDALWNNAFSEFVQRYGVSEARVLRGVGFLLKS